MANHSRTKPYIEALGGFADAVKAKHSAPPSRIEVSVDAQDGMAVLAAVDTALNQYWPHGVPRELSWLGNSRSTIERLRLVALDERGRVIEGMAFPALEEADV